MHHVVRSSNKPQQTHRTELPANQVKFKLVNIATIRQ